jgi:hypothetical protein
MHRQTTEVTEYIANCDFTHTIILQVANILYENLWFSKGKGNPNRSEGTEGALEWVGG